MTEQEIKDIFNSDRTHREVWKRLGEETKRIILEVMVELPAEDFKECNPFALFDFTDIPVPYKKLENQNESGLVLDEPIEAVVSDLLVDINTPGKNLEYPQVFVGLQNDEVDYFANKEMQVGGTQSCAYDFDWIENFIKNKENAGSKLALFHTHPKSFSEKHNTLFNKHPEILSKVGVLPDGLNISMSDIYVMQYIDMLIEKHKADITAESIILMHNGDLISYSTKGGMKLTAKRALEMSSKLQNE